MFAHPPTPYFQGPLPPPAQYPAPYDPMAQPPYAPSYYAMPAAPYPPNGVPSPVHTMPPPNGMRSSPQPPPPNQGRPSAEAPSVSPVQTTYSPLVHPMQYAVQMPPGYPQQGQGHLPPIPVGMPSLPPPLPPVLPTPQPNGVSYQPTSPVVQPLRSPVHRRDSSAMHPHANGPSPLTNGDAERATHSQPLPQQGDGYTPVNRQLRRESESMGHARRGSFRRGGMMGGGGGKHSRPPCLFFPSGRCRNGYVFLDATCGLRVSNLRRV